MIVFGQARGGNFLITRFILTEGEREKGNFTSPSILGLIAKIQSGTKSGGLRTDPLHVVGRDQVALYSALSINPNFSHYAQSLDYAHSLIVHPKLAISAAVNWQGCPATTLLSVS